MGGLEKRQMNESPKPIDTFKVDALQVETYADRAAMGRSAGAAVAERMRDAIASKGAVSVVFAAAPSQDDFLAALREEPRIEWDKVIAFHLDEYVGLNQNAPQSFRNYLRRTLYDHVRPGVMHLILGEAEDPEAECQRYGDLLGRSSPDIACLGIGENGHIAFNDPPVADFEEKQLMKVVELDETCRMQQVHDGCFSRLEDVPTLAFTMTIPAVMSCRYLFTMVPSSRKAQAVRDALRGPVTTRCPASILRKHPRATIYLDSDSAGLL
jgi:glucosamine-6-phosphate deaminase